MKIGNVATDLNAKTSGQVLIGNGTDIVSVPITGDASISPTGVVTINSFGPIESGTGVGSIQSKNSITGATDINDYSINNESIKERIAALNAA